MKGASLGQKRLKGACLGLRKTEREILAIVASFCPSLTPIDCNIGRLHGIVTFNNPTEIPIIFEENMMKKFEEYSLRPKPHPSYYANRSIYLTNIRPFIAQRTADELLEEINQHNEHIKVESVWKIAIRDSMRHVLN